MPSSCRWCPSGSRWSHCLWPGYERWETHQKGKIDRAILTVWGEVDLTLAGQEVIALPLATKLRGKLFCRHLLERYVPWLGSLSLVRVLFHLIFYKSIIEFPRAVIGYSIACSGFRIIRILLLAWGNSIITNGISQNVKKDHGAVAQLGEGHRHRGRRCRSVQESRLWVRQQFK